MSTPPKFIDMNGEQLFVNGHEPTITAVRSGSWNNPGTWDQNRTPTCNDDPYIPEGYCVVGHCDIEMRHLVASGTLKILHGTKLYYTTITGLPKSLFVAGSPGNPIGFTAYHNALPFHSEDTQQFGNGIVWCGHHDHKAVLLYGHKPNGEHSIRFLTNSSAIRPHIMFMHALVEIEGVLVQAYGRTDKSVVLSATNLAGRYPLHFHKAGTAYQSIVKNVKVDGSPGWGIVIHGSNVGLEDSEVWNVFGAGIVGEDSTEKGYLRRCMARDITSRLKPHTAERQAANDIWQSGEGFAFSGVGIEVDNCLAQHVNSGFSWFTLPGVDASNPAPVRNLNVIDWQLTGLWLAARLDDRIDWDQLHRIEHAKLRSGGPKSIGLLVEYDQGRRFTDLSIDGCDIGIEQRNFLANVAHGNLTIKNARIGHTNGKNSLGESRFTGGSVAASEVGFQCNAPTHQVHGRIVRIDGVDIDAPVPVRLTGTPPQGVTNEVWLDGELQTWP